MLSNNSYCRAQNLLGVIKTKGDMYAEREAVRKGYSIDGSGRLQEMNAHDRHSLTLYVTLEPCLMCSAALSVAGIKRIVYAALAEDANLEQMIVDNLTLSNINQQLVRGPFILVPGVRRTEGQELLRRMNKAANAPPDIKM